MMKFVVFFPVKIMTKKTLVNNKMVHNYSVTLKNSRLNVEKELKKTLNKKINILGKATMGNGNVSGEAGHFNYLRNGNLRNNFYPLEFRPFLFWESKQLFFGNRTPYPHRIGQLPLKTDQFS